MKTYQVFHDFCGEGAFQLQGINEAYQGFVQLPIPEQMLQEAYSKFCFCEGSETHAQTSDKTSKPKAIPGKQPMRMKQFGFDEMVEVLIEQVLDLPLSGDRFVARGSPKPVPKSGPLCSTRSSYIGVTRNGSRWQAMINIGTRKIYIASYRNEKDAAVCFDLHSMMIHSVTAKVNFDYQKDELLQLLEAYKENGYVY